jgi:uncharacterized protein YndB with AHSA1/START domain
MADEPVERSIYAEVTIAASIDQAWEAWTTAAGAQSFFGPLCRIELRPHGAYEILFDLEAEPGKRGGESMLVLAVQPKTMLAFTWNAPPELPTVRGQMTRVIIRLRALDAAHTLVSLRHDGWGEGGEWDAAFNYFVRAWKQVVLPRLKYRFEVGPIDWNHLPHFD